MASLAAIGPLPPCLLQFQLPVWPGCQEEERLMMRISLPLNPCSSTQPAKHARNAWLRIFWITCFGALGPYIKILTTIHIQNNFSSKTAFIHDVTSKLGKKHFFVNSEILGIQIWWKKRVNYDKFEIVTKQPKSNI